MRKGIDLETGQCLFVAKATRRRRRILRAGFYSYTTCFLHTLSQGKAGAVYEQN